MLFFRFKHTPANGWRSGWTIAGVVALFFSMASPLAADVAQEAYVKASDSAADDSFGYSVAISGNTMVVGANEANGKAGAAYVYVLDGGMWSQQAKLTGSNTEAEDEFGFAVAIHGDTIVVGAPEEESNATGVNGDQSDNSLSRPGAVYVFTRAGGIWTQQAYLKASNTDPNDRFGDAVDIFEDLVVVGAWGERSSAQGINGDQANNLAIFAGAAYVFRRSGTEWAQEAYLKASNAEAQDYFGWSVSVWGAKVAIGARRESSIATGVNGDQTSNSIPDSGAVYVFGHFGGAWSQLAYIKSSNTTVINSLGQGFGWSVDLSGDTLAVGAPFEPSNSKGVNGDQTDNSAQKSGAVYVFRESVAGWAQEAYIKASNSGQFDEFGYSVAVAGKTLAVAARFEASNALGIDGDESNNQQPLAGAVYVLTRDNDVWSQQNYIKASNTQTGDQFGASVALGSERLIVGAIGESSSAKGIDGDQADNSLDDAGAAYIFSGLDTALLFAINAGVNDAWVSADAPFQGFFFTFFPNLKVFFLSWFTFDSVLPTTGTATFGAIDQRWITASGVATDDRVTLNVELTSGGIFNGSVPAANQTPGYGTITIVFLNCSEATLSYEFPSLGISGQMTVTRVVSSNVALCEVLNGA